MQVGQRIYRAAQSLFMEDAYIARVYYESMRDNFEGYDVTNDVDGFERLRGDFKSLVPGGDREPTLGELFRIELALLRHLPDSAVESRFWSIDDRFRRTVPQSVIDSYDRRIPPLGDAKWSTIDFVRSQSRTLLDVIHANYLINLGREQSTKRLMFIIAMASLFILAIAAVLTLTAPGDVARQGLVLFAVAGMFGAIISIVNRLQKATSRDAMAQDGIFELIGLRTGWVSILMSITIGGVFALVLYAMVMGGVVDLFVPELGPLEPGEREGAGDVGDESAASEQSEGSEQSADSGDAIQPGTNPAIADAATAQNASANTPPQTGNDGDASGSGDAAASGDADDGEEDEDDGTDDVTECPNEADDCPGWIDRVAEALHFETRLEVFKMIVLAFVAGFAERFVPDILNRLGKDSKS